jgi:hypothetical protein
MFTHANGREKKPLEEILILTSKRHHIGVHWLFDHFIPKVYNIIHNQMLLILFCVSQSIICALACVLC